MQLNAVCRVFWYALLYHGGPLVRYPCPKPKSAKAQKRSTKHFWRKVKAWCGCCVSCFKHSIKAKPNAPRPRRNQQSEKHAKHTANLAYKCPLSQSFAQHCLRQCGVLSLFKSRKFHAANPAPRICASFQPHPKTLWHSKLG